MKPVLIHGLGQTAASWEPVTRILAQKGMTARCPDLFALLKRSGAKTADYAALYRVFAAWCEAQEGPLDLCGLSLGGLLALDYACRHPEKVASLVLAATPYEVPAGLLRLQNTLFRFLPKPAFESMGCTKKDFLSLTRSLEKRPVPQGLDAIRCRCLVLCGRRDKVNMESAVRLHFRIPGSGFRLVQDAGHELNADNPCHLAAILQAFWNAEDPPFERA